MYEYGSCLRVCSERPEAHCNVRPLSQLRYIVSQATTHQYHLPFSRHALHFLHHLGWLIFVSSARPFSRGPTPDWALASVPGRDPGRPQPSSLRYASDDRALHPCPPSRMEAPECQSGKKSYIWASFVLQHRPRAAGYVSPRFVIDLHAHQLSPSLFALQLFFSQLLPVYIKTWLSLAFFWILCQSSPSELSIARSLQHLFLISISSRSGIPDLRILHNDKVRGSSRTGAGRFGRVSVANSDSNSHPDSHPDSHAYAYVYAGPVSHSQDRTRWLHYAVLLGRRQCPSFIWRLCS